MVWSGDEGTTEASGRTRRLGIDFEGRARLATWLWADADVNPDLRAFGDDPSGANFVPLAPTMTSTGGLSARDVGPLGGGVRYRHVGGWPADETNNVDALGYTVTEVFASREISRIELVLTVGSFFNINWNEAQFAMTSRPSRKPNGGITELNSRRALGVPSVRLGLR